MAVLLQLVREDIAGLLLTSVMQFTSISCCVSRQDYSIMQLTTLAG